MAAFLAMLLKIYPIVVFAVIVMASSSKKYFYWIFFTVVYVILIWVKLDYQELQLLNSIIPRPTGIYTFGFSELLGYTGNFKWLIILLAISGFLISLKKIIPKIQIRFLTTKDVKAIYYLYGLIITGSLFLITTSYDYKLIFIIFTLPLLFSKNGILVNIAIALGACVLWAEYARQLLHVPLAHYYFNDTSTTHLTATLDFLVFIKNFLIAVYLSFMFILGAIAIFPKKINASIK